MKRLFAVPIAVLFVAACSDATAPAHSSPDVSARLGRSLPAPPPPPPVCTSGANCATFDDTQGITAADGYGIAGGTTTSPSGEGFSRRLGNESLVIAPSGTLPSTIDVRFALYTIGAWDGEPKKGPDNVIRWTWQCGIGGAPQPLMYASFGNRLSSVTSFPDNVSDKGHYGGQYYNTGLDGLGYRTSGTTPFYQGSGDVADARYNLQRTITQNCGPGEFRMTLTGAGLSGASWGIDNFSIN